ncbi:two-component sensor histidine kinase [Ramlibacter sp. G-1-2-2]|uniref:histidine kinase n=1 Tax=Ramlibacter agri TaxID=2728837 RepID=A0A848H1D8_9BURK|nr:two-component sensor histidine kinase [Ramlibacter agri]
MKRNSLQWRLSLGLSITLLLACAVAGGVSFAWALHDANEIMDDLLHETGALIANGQMHLPAQAAQLPGSEPDNDLLIVPLRPGSAAPAPLASLPDGIHTIEWNGGGWRVLLQPLAQGERVAVAQRTQVRDEVAFHSAIRTLIPLLALIPVLALLMREIVRRTLEPVGRLAHHVDSHASARAAALPEVEVPAEVQPFLHSIKRLLGDLTSSLARQERFVANAAHELRSPVAALRLQAANVEAVLDDDEARSRLAELQLGIARIQHLLEQLLSMARVEAPLPAAAAPVGVAGIACDVLAELVPSAQAKGVDLGMERCERDACLQASELDLRTLMHNVVGNAVKYCPAGGRVSLSVYVEAGDAVISVVDDGPGIPPAELTRAFEPFYRVPGASETGSGLGLAIVAAVAHRYAGRITLAPAAGTSGLRFEYRQPACHAA